MHTFILQFQLSANVFSPSSITLVSLLGSERPQLTFSTIHMTYKKDMASPFVTVTLRDANGAQLERTLETPPGVFDPKTHVLQLGHALPLQTPVTAIPHGVTCTVLCAVCCNLHCVVCCML